MIRHTQQVEDIVRMFFSEWDKPELDDTDVDAHTGVFMLAHFDHKKLGGAYGYTPEKALRSQLLEYCREAFDYSDPREGE